MGTIFLIVMGEMMFMDGTLLKHDVFVAFWTFVLIIGADSCYLMREYEFTGYFVEGSCVHVFLYVGRHIPNTQEYQAHII